MIAILNTPVAIALQNMINSDHYEVVVKVWCVSQVVLRYFHLTTFFWMFLEGQGRMIIKCLVYYTLILSK